MKVSKGLYQHFKGAFYRVLDVAKHSETEEEVVVYQALYGDKGMWVRPLSMFTEAITHDGETRPRFARLDQQTEVLEVAVLDVKPELGNDFEAAFAQAQSIIAGMSGYIFHDLQKCLETVNRYVLLVGWQRLEDHTEGFRGSDEYILWKEQLHHFYDPFPLVEHYQTANLSD